MYPPKSVPGTFSASPPFGPKAFAARQSHVRAPQPSAQYVKKANWHGPALSSSTTISLLWQELRVGTCARFHFSEERNKADACAAGARAPRALPGRAEGDARAPAALRSARARRPRGEPGTVAAVPGRPPRRAAHLAGHQRLDLLHDGPAAAPTALSGRARRRGTAQPCWAPPDRARPRLPGSGSSRATGTTTTPGSAAGRAGPGVAVFEYWGSGVYFWTCLAQEMKRRSVCGDKLERTRRWGEFPGCGCLGFFRALCTMHRPRLASSRVMDVVLHRQKRLVSLLFSFIDSNF